MAARRFPDPTLMARLQLSVKGVDWAASLVKPWQYRRLDGEWSAHENVFHLVGNELVFQERIRGAIAHDSPVFERWDSMLFMEEQYTLGDDIDRLAERFMAARGETYELFRGLSDEQWRRTATWPDGRFIDLAWIAEKVLWHALDHFAGLLDLHGEFEPLQGQVTIGE